MSERCEPPEAYRGRRWHWIHRHGHGREPMRWSQKQGLWWHGYGSWTPEEAAKMGAVYWAPIEDPPRKKVTG